MAQRLTRANTTRRQRRHRRIRARVRGTPGRPRLSVFRSAQHVMVQVIDDASGRTIAAASDADVAMPGAGNREPGAGVSRKVAFAHAVGTMIAERAKAKGVVEVVFDRGGYAYHGRVRAVADGAREGGLEF